MNKVTPQIQAIASKLSSAFKRRNNAPSITNPPSHNDDRQYRLSRLLLVVSLTLLLLLSIAALVLKAYSYGFIEFNAEMGFYLVNDEVQGEPEGENLVAALPHNLFRVPEKLVLVVAMLNILLSTAHLAFVSWDWKSGRRTQTRAFRRNAIVLHIINAILVLTALIAMSVSHKASSPFKYDLIPKTPNAVSPSGYRYYRYDSGIFDLETWTCELENAKGAGEARKDYQAQCDIEVAGRTIMVPFFLVALAVAGLSVWALVIGGKHGTRSEHLYTKDADLEMGKGAEDGKQVQVEEVELATLEGPDRQKEGRLSKIEEGGEETEEAPKESETTLKIEAADALSAESKDVDAKKEAGAS
ncbi:hypothetical protein BU25DRAFT_345841 [Macroventuria anomochaeta]|uniref:Uncharacterized protein n=1 Tax=Macroventuria anomochaeta TaxID=301207 RepID=A0ACB6RX91_9PLEO|nr:uncharacterized protein BU25DRAFT_345841 [Macroventuria anomochaeta]KAF2625507.1 hypothetical protein BU25DRAFT_345841 [Macroventuria anomochaeta]